MKFVVWGAALFIACGSPSSQCLRDYPEPLPGKPYNVCIHNPAACETCGVRFEVPDAGPNDWNPR